MEIKHVTDLKNAIDIIETQKASRVSSTLHGFPCTEKGIDLGSFYEHGNRGVELILEWSGPVSVNDTTPGHLVQYNEFRNGNNLYIVMENNNPNHLKLKSITISDYAKTTYLEEMRKNAPRKFLFFKRRVDEKDVDSIIQRLNSYIMKGLYISVV